MKNHNNMLLNTTHIFTSTINIKIIDLDKKVPYEEIDNLLYWLKHKAVEVGTGLKKEYYSYTDNHVDDIGVLFNVCQ